LLLRELSFQSAHGVAAALQTNPSFGNPAALYANKENWADDHTVAGFKPLVLLDLVTGHFSVYIIGQQKWQRTAFTGPWGGTPSQNPPAWWGWRSPTNRLLTCSES